MALSCTYDAPKYGSTRLCDQNWGVEIADSHTDSTHTDRQKVKTEGPLILSNDIFYFKTVIIGGPISIIYKIFTSCVGCIKEKKTYYKIHFLKTEFSTFDEVISLSLAVLFMYIGKNINHRKKYIMSLRF